MDPVAVCHYLGRGQAGPWGGGLGGPAALPRGAPDPKRGQRRGGWALFCIRGDAPTWQLPEPGRAQTMAMDAGVDGPCPVVPAVRAAALRLGGEAALPGNHGAGVRLAGCGGDGAQLREAAVAGLQAAHGAPVGTGTGEGHRRMEVSHEHSHSWPPLPCPASLPRPLLPRLPEVLGADDLGVVHDLALVRGHLQRGQHVVHAGQAGGGTGRRAVKAPLQDVEAGPAGHMRALWEGAR